MEKNKNRPNLLVGITIGIDTLCGKIYVTIRSTNNELYDVRIEEENDDEDKWFYPRLVCAAISRELQVGEDVDYLTEELDQFKCCKKADMLCLSCFRGISMVMRYVKYLRLKEGKIFTLSFPDKSSCPECETRMVFQECCLICYGCGYTRCF